MAVTGVATVVTFGVWDTIAGAWKTGDAANLTLRLIADGAESTPSGTPAEVDATNVPGQYKLALTLTENAGTSLTLGGKSSTAGCVVIPACWENLDATIASRSAYAGGDTAGTGTLLTRLSSARAGYLENLSAGAVALEDTITAIKGSGWVDENLVDIQAAAVAASGAIGTGSKPVTVQVNDGAGNGVPNTKVTVQGVTGLTTIGIQTTISTGATLNGFGLYPATTYKVILSGPSAQYTPANPYTITTAAGTGAQTLTLVVTAASIPAPASPSNFTIYGYETIVEEGDAALPAMTVEICELSGGRVNATGNLIRNLMHHTATTDAAGLWSFEIPLALDGHRIGLKRTVTGADETSRTETLRATIDTSLVSAGLLAFADLSPE